MGFGYGDVGRSSVVHEAQGEQIFQVVHSENWLGENEYRWYYDDRPHGTLEAAKQALTEKNKQKFSEYATVDFSNLKSDPNWRETLLNHAIYVAGLGNLNDDDIKNMQDKFAAYKIEDIIDVEAEGILGDWYEVPGGTGLPDDPKTPEDESKMARGAKGRTEDIYGLAGEKREQALKRADISLKSMMGGLQEEAYKGAPAMSTGVDIRGQLMGKDVMREKFETGYDKYGLAKTSAESAYKGAGITYQAGLGAYASGMEALETGYETTLSGELASLFPDIFGQAYNKGGG